jgi:hypothetical protein
VTSPTSPTQTHISRQDLERRFQALQDGLQGKVHDRKQSLVATGTAIGVVLVIIVYLLGRRSGRKKTTLVEIRRL